MEIINYRTALDETLIQIIIPAKQQYWNQIINKIESLEIKGFTNILNNKIYLNVINNEIKKNNFTKFINWVCELHPDE